MPDFTGSLEEIALAVALVESARFITVKLIDHLTNRKNAEVETLQVETEKEVFLREFSEKSEEEFRKDLLEVVRGLWGRLDKVETTLRDERNRYFQLLAEKAKLQQEKNLLELENNGLTTKITILESKISQLEERISDLEEERMRILSNSQE